MHHTSRPFTINEAKLVLTRLAANVLDPYNDGWTASLSKKELYEFKCWLEDMYSKLPTFVGEEEWEQERIIQILSMKKS